MSSTPAGISFNFSSQTNTNPTSFGTTLNTFSTASFGSTSAPSFGGTSGSAFAGFASSTSFGSSWSFSAPAFSFSSAPSFATSVPSFQGIGASSSNASSLSLLGSSFVTNSSSNSTSGPSLFSTPSSVASSGSSSSFSFTVPFSQQQMFSNPASSGASSSFSFGNVATTSLSTSTFTTSSVPSFQSTSFSFGATGPSSSSSMSFATFGATSGAASVTSFSSSSFSLPLTTASTQVASFSSAGVATSSASLSAPFLFTNQSSSVASTSTSSTSLSAPSLFTIPSSSLFGSSSSSAAASSSSLTFTGFSKEASSSVAAGTSVGASLPSFVGTSTQSIPTSSSEPVSEVKDLNLSEIINSWNDKVEELVDRFRRQASIVNRWDRYLYQNERRIESLYTEAQGIHSAHKELEMNLDTALAQQKELDGYLQTLENQLEKYFDSVGDMGSTFADYEREEMYRTATKMASELDTIGTSLREVISDIHRVNKPAEDDVVGQIVAILDAHLKSLEYLDETCSQLGKRTQQVQLLTDRVERDTQRWFSSPLGN